MDVEARIEQAKASPAGVLLATIGFVPESRTGLAFYYQGPGVHLTTREYEVFPEMDDAVYLWGDNDTSGEPRGAYPSVKAFVDDWRAGRFGSTSALKGGAPVFVALLVTLVGGMVHAAGPEPYTIDTVTGLESRTIENSLYDAVWRMVRPVATAHNFTEAEEECAKATAAQRLLEVTRDAMSTSIVFRFDGYEKAQDHFKRGEDDWCNKSGGKRGADLLAPYIAKSKSFLRPFFAERLDAIQKAEATPLTPAQVTAIIVAALVTMPVWALP